MLPTEPFARDAELRAVAVADGAAEALAQLGGGGRVWAATGRVLAVEASGGHLLALHTADVPPMPFSLVVDRHPPAWPGPRTAVRLADGVLHLDHLAVSLAAPRTVDTRLAAIRAWPGALAAVAEAALTPFAARAAFGPWWGALPGADSSVAAELARRARPAIRDLRTARYPAALRRAAERLIGLGQGSTPSGDDALAGFLATWLACEPGAPAAHALAAWLAAEAPAQTTRLAAELYHHLARARASLPLRELLAALGTADLAIVGRAAGHLAGLGATSGADTIAGVHAWLTRATDFAEAAPETG